MKAQPRLESIVFALLLVVIFSLALMRPALDTGVIGLTGTDLVFPLLFGFWLVLLIVRREGIMWSPQYLGFAAFLVLLVPSIVASSDQYLSLTRLAGEVYLVLLAVITSQVVNDVRRFRLVLIVWLAGSLLPISLALAGIVLYYLAPGNALLELITYHYGAAPAGYFPRINSTFVSPSMFCNYLTVTLAIAVIAGRLGWISRRRTVLMIVAITLAAIFTVSMALGGFFLASGLLFLWMGGRTKWWAVPCIGLALAFLVIAPIDITGNNWGASSRMLVWSDAFKIFAESPIAGRGLGLPVADVTYRNSDGSMSLLADAHNTYLSVLAQSGLVGFLGFIVMISMLLKSASLRLKGEGEYGVMSNAFTLAFIAAFLFNGFTGSFEDARHLWVLMGLMIAAGKLRPAAA